MSKFHNTINLQGDDLSRAEQKARTQNEIILDFFQNNPEKELTPFEVQSQAGLFQYPITSIRRALTDLTKDDKLEKTACQKKGNFGTLNYCWKLKNSQLTLF